MVKSKLYSLNLSMSGGALYCTEESLYNKVQAVQVELIHVWRGLVLHRGSQYGEVHFVQGEVVHVWRGLVLHRGSQYGEVQAVQAELVHVWRGLVLYRGVPVQ